MITSVFLGTPEIAVPALEVLAERTVLRAVITRPGGRGGRGHRPLEPPVGRAAAEKGIPVHAPSRLGTAEARMLEVDLAVVMAYGALLREEQLRAPAMGCVNLHCSLLPRWRGAAPLQAALRAGDPETGVTVMRMVRRLDAGPILLRRAFPLPADATLPWLHDRMAEEAAAALGEYLDRHEELEPVPQDEAAATWCGRLTVAEGRLDPTLPAAELERQVRAYTPAPGCWLGVDGERIKIHAAAIAENPGLGPGELAARDGRLLLGCAESALAITRLQSPGGRAMDADAWLRGHAPPRRVDPGAPGG